MPDSCVALTGATEPTNPEDPVDAGAGAASVVAGDPDTVVETDVGTTADVGVDVPVEGTGAVLTRAWPWCAAIRGVLEQAARRPLERSPVATTTTRWRPGRGTDAHHSRGVPATARAAVVAIATVLLASCGGARPLGVTHRVATDVVPSTTSTVATTVPTTVPSTPPTTEATTVPTTVPVTARTTTPVPATTAPHPAPPAPLLVTRLVGVGSATQVIAVSASSYGQTVATLTAYQDGATGWHQVFGPWQADVGYGGFAPPGQKREGDGRTPSGSFGFDFFFGVLGDPGVQFPFRAVTGPTIVWDDDPSSPLYNQWVDTSTANAGAAPEPMDVSAYDYGAVIAYNMNPTVPGAGSAIFLHVSDGGPTVGCVSLPTGELLPVLRWLNPAAQPRIIMGTAATIAP